MAETLVPDDVKDQEIFTTVAQVWSEILGLGLNEIAADDAFLNLGGTSIAAEQIAARLCDHYRIDLTGSDVLRQNVLAEFVAEVRARLDSTS
jgi:hypothetical protein